MNAGMTKQEIIKVLEGKKVLSAMLVVVINSIVSRWG
jgi:hypothetical protein